MVCHNCQEHGNKWIIQLESNDLKMVNIKVKDKMKDSDINGCFKEDPNHRKNSKILILKAHIMPKSSFNRHSLNRKLSYKNTIKSSIFNTYQMFTKWIKLPLNNMIKIEECRLN